jgi:hypothetical protein
MLLFLLKFSWNLHTLLSQMFEQLLRWKSPVFKFGKILFGLHFGRFIQISIWSPWLVCFLVNAAAVALRTYGMVLRKVTFRVCFSTSDILGRTVLTFGKVKLGHVIFGMWYWDKCVIFRVTFKKVTFRKKIFQKLHLCKRLPRKWHSFKWHLDNWH